MAEGVAAGDRETTRDVKGQGRTRAEPMTHHPRSMGDSTRIRRDFEEDNSRSVETNELTDSLFRPRLHQCDSRGIKPRMQSRQEKAKQLPANTASLPQAEALYDPPSSRSLSSVAHDEVESGIDSTAEIDPPLSIHPDKVKIKTNTKLVINIPKQSGKETPAGGCLVKFSRCNLTAKAMAARGNNPNMAQVITPEWPVPGEVTVTLYTKTANEKCIIGKGTVTFYPEGEKVTAPRLFVFDSVHKMTPQHIKAVLEGALLSGIEPSLEAPASSTLELHSETNIFVCLQDNSKIIQAYSHYIYVHFPECGLPCADLTLPELRARLGHLVRVISGGNNEGSNDKRQGGSVSYVTETVESVEDAPLYTAVAGAASEGSTDETIYDCPRDETVPLIIVGDSVVSRISPTSLLAEREVKRSRVDTTSNGLCIDTKLDMSSETALRLISRFMAGQMSQNRVVEDALDYVRFKRASQKKSKKWKVNASFARRRKETKVNVSSKSSTDSHSVHRRWVSSKARFNLKKKDCSSSSNADISSCASNETADVASIRKPKSLPKSSAKLRTTESSLKRSRKFDGSSDSGIYDCKDPTSGRGTPNQFINRPVSYSFAKSVRDPRSVLPPTPSSENEG